MFRPQGVYVAMMTPFAKDGHVQEDTLRSLVDFLISKKVHGLFPVSSVGESVHLTLEERLRVMKIVVQEAAGRVPVTPGVGTSRPAHSIELARQAAAMGCTAVVVAPPYFYRISEGMLESYFLEIAQNSPVPVILYNIPLFTQPISPQIVGRLSLLENVVGLKESSGSMVDLVHFMDEVRQQGGEISFLSGREDIFFPSLAVGASGCMTATACVLPEAMVAIYQAWDKGDWALARSLQMQLVSFIRACFSVPFPSGFKLAMECRGFPMGPPLQPLSSQEAAQLEVARARIGQLIEAVLQKLKGPDS
ncbi:MAG: dihydrodipicolinate synthase family protein [bacterium]